MEETKVAASHLEECASCRRTVRELQYSLNLLKELPEVEPPPFFEERIMADIRRKAYEKKGLWRRLFFPLEIKIPLQAVASILIAVLAFHIYDGGEPEIKSMGPLPPATLDSPQVTDKQIAVPKDGVSSIASGDAARISSPAKSNYLLQKTMRGATTPAPAAKQAESLNAPLPEATAKEKMEQKQTAGVQAGAFSSVKETESRIPIDMLQHKKKDKSSPTGTTPSGPLRAAKSSRAPAMSEALPDGNSVKLSASPQDEERAMRELDILLARINGRILEKNDKAPSRYIRIALPPDKMDDLLEGLERIGIPNKPSLLPSNTGSEIIAIVDFPGRH